MIDKSIIKNHIMIYNTKHRHILKLLRAVAHLSNDNVFDKNDE